MLVYFKRLLRRFLGRETRVVLDTNIIIAAATKSKGSSARILWKALEKGELRLCVSPQILDEYQHILKPFGFALKRFGGREGLMSRIEEAALLVEPKMRVRRIKADISDNMFLACALAAKAEYVITSDRHFNFRSFRGVKVRKSGEFLGEINA